MTLCHCPHAFFEFPTRWNGGDGRTECYFEMASTLTVRTLAPTFAYVTVESPVVVVSKGTANTVAVTKVLIGGLGDYGFGNDSETKSFIPRLS
jgi:hypothetical protein